jgi:hypothetical protein
MTFGGGHETMKPGDDDKRYRLSIILAAEKRPKYWDFHCCRCTTKIVELSGVVLAISDVSDLEAQPEYQAAPLNVECKGRWCRTWYEFLTLSGKM